jgi:hypothetical protein
MEEWCSSVENFDKEECSCFPNYTGIKTKEIKAVLEKLQTIENRTFNLQCFSPECSSKGYKTPLMKRTSCPHECANIMNITRSNYSTDDSIYKQVTLCVNQVIATNDLPNDEIPSDDIPNNTFVYIGFILFVISVISLAIFLIYIKLKKVKPLELSTFHQIQNKNNSD